MTTAYQHLRTTFTRLSRFEHLSAIAGWDMQTMMPAKGNLARSEAMAELNVLQHQILTAKQVGEWLMLAEQETLDSVEQALLIKSEREQYSVFDMHPLN